MSIEQNIFLQPHIIKILTEDDKYKNIMINIGNILLKLDKYNVDIRKLSTQQEINIKSELEKHFASSNMAGTDSHRCHRTTIKKAWFKQTERIEGSILNHSYLFERKGYEGDALLQLKRWAQELPLVHKLIALRPKWGLDFSMDYVDRDGNTFEVLHWEWDSFDHNEIQAVKQKIEPILSNIDWQDAGKQILTCKDQWHHLDFFAQSDWKCEYFGISKERFKMVIWN
jgi:hypothetical protein